MSDINGGRTAKIPTASESNPVKRVLNAGSGPASNQKLHAFFLNKSWRVVRLDINAAANPDIVCSLTDMKALVPSASFDAVWSAHSLEHLYAHEVPLALSEFKRVSKPSGFVIITSPDLEMVASLILRHGLDGPAYVSPKGPITPRDILFGHSQSIARGDYFMAHRTGFTSASLGKLLVNAGFAEALIKREDLNLWALALMDEANKSAICADLRSYGLDMFDGETEQ
jgi:SAM-dependent methyltransferase